MSTLELKTREEINEFLKAGHEQYVSTEERFQIIQQFLQRKRQRELDLSDLVISEKRRAINMEKPEASVRRSPRLATKPATKFGSGRFLDQRRRLTNRANQNVTKPQMKLGIFNHFCKSRNVKMRTFDEAQIAEAEGTGFKPIEAAESLEISVPVAKPIEELASDRNYCHPLPELSVVEPYQETESESEQIQRNEFYKALDMSEEGFAAFLDMVVDSSDSSSHLDYLSDFNGSSSDEFSSASSSSQPSSIL